MAAGRLAAGGYQTAVHSTGAASAATPAEPGFFPAGRGMPAYLALLLLMAGDGESNPGPVRCSSCARWIPRRRVPELGAAAPVTPEDDDLSRVCGECVRGLGRLGVRHGPDRWRRTPGC